MTNKRRSDESAQAGPLARNGQSGPAATRSRPAVPEFAPFDVDAFLSSGRLDPGAWVVELPSSHESRRTCGPLIGAAEKSGAAVIEIQCDPARPRHAVRTLVREAARLVESRGHKLALPPLVAAAGVDRDATQLHADLASWRETVFNLNEGISGLVDLAARDRALLLVVHDAEHADADSLAALRHIVSAVAAQHATPWSDRTRLSVIMSYHRADDAAVAVPVHLADWAEELARVGARIQRVSGLTRRELWEWLEHSSVLDQLLEWSEGSTARLEQNVTDLPRLVRAVRDAERPTSADEQRVAALLALSELPLGAGEIGRALGLDDFSVRRIVTSLAQSGWVRSGARGRLEVAPAERQALRDGLDSTTESQLHESLADALADRWTFDQEDSGLEAAACHWLRAGQAPRALRFGLRAGDHLESQLALHRAHALYRSLLPCAKGEEAARVALRLARVCIALARNPEAAAVLRDLEADGLVTAPSRQLVVGQLYLKAGSLDAAIRLLAASSACDDADVAGQAALHLAQAYCESGDLKAGLKSLAFARGDDGERHMTEGNIRFREGDMDGARRAYHAGAQASRDALTKSRALHNVGLVAIRQSRFGDAVTALQRSLVACENAGEYYGAALCHSNLGVAYEHMERYALALRSVAFACDVFARLGNQHMHASGLATWGDLALQLGDPRRANRLLRRSLRLAEGVGSDFKAAFAKSKLARVAIVRGRLGRAQRWLDDAIEALQAQGQRDTLAWAYCTAAELAVAKRDWTALEAAEEQLDALGLSDDHEAHAQLSLLQAQAHAERGDLESAAEAAAEAAARYRAMDGRRGLIRALAILAQIRPEAVQAERWRAEANELRASLLQEVPADQQRRFARLPWMAPSTGPAAVSTEVEGNGSGVDASAPALDVRGAEPTSRQESTEHMVLGCAHPALPNLLGQSAAMAEVGQWVERVAGTEATVLLFGESGTGKELVAEAIHAGSPRAKMPFVRVNVAALPESLLESELFGHERGAFTGAVARRKGKFEIAHGGTLFLDEIGDISPATQVRLLRVLQDHCFERVGGTETIHADVRVLCATNRDLSALVDSGAFRLDLYHRIRGVTLALPALRDRGDDALHLARYFLRRHGLKSGRTMEFDSEAESLLARYGWPGNVRELENVVRTAYVLGTGPVVRATDLQIEHAGASAAATGRAPRAYGGLEPGDELPNLDEAKRSLEVSLIECALDRTDGNITHAAALLGMKRPRLSQKIREYGMSVPGRDEG